MNLSTSPPRGWLAVALIVAALAAPAQAQVTKLTIDAEHSTVSFKVRHLFTKVNGQFRKIEGAIDMDAKNLVASRVAVTIKAASIDTNVEARDKDLRSKRFFDVETFPDLTFTSTSITGVSSAAKIRGVLSMHGVSREVVLDAQFLGSAKDPWGNQRYGFHAETKVNRKDFGMAWNEVIEAGGVMVGDEVEISLDIEAVPAKS